MFWITFEIVALILVVVGVIAMAHADRRTAQLREAEEQAEQRARSKLVSDDSNASKKSDDHG